jgi:hypothetical protein
MWLNPAAAPTAVTRIGLLKMVGEEPKSALRIAGPGMVRDRPVPLYACKAD